MEKEKYTVLSMNMGGGYELVHDIKEKSDRARYIMVTDDPNLKSDDWEIIYDDGLTGTAWDKCMQVRYNPFKYTTDKIVLKIDGSIGINKSLDIIIDKFIEGNYDMSLMFHPTRNTMLEEYSAWVNIRNYELESARFILNFLSQKENYDINNHKGLCQLCYQIQTNNEINNKANQLTLAFLKYLGKEQMERVDQCIFSFVLQKYFSEAKIMWVDQRIVQSAYLTFYPHNSMIPFKTADPKTFTAPYWNHVRIHNYLRPQDL